MNFDYIDQFYNLKYGNCYLIDSQNKYNLVYAEKCFKHYIVCDYIDEMGAMLNQKFFETLEQASEYFNEMKEKKNGRIL